ncbi:putative LRR receptor-like serine/threonine-protein kinase [Heracleum sosnowskyi]|uniref:non-specific serine/threonine protein kinase n=1 Tax=Heracleum sosnowskyi TaxID=360622 RepID=A0AAD8M1G9_9APIA|nr:putative LRR receptor-like serine/threonine-protein kinase [Heracleum sosnowskyi]
MGLHSLVWFEILLVFGCYKYAFCDQNGFLSLSCGGTVNFVDSSNITWTPDSTYVTTGTPSTVNFPEGNSSSIIPIRFFPETKGRKCYWLPIKNVSSLVLVRTKFLYKNYDGLAKPPTFSVSLGTAIATTINLANADPWTEEFLWPVNKDYLSLCLNSVPGGGFPVISSVEVRPLPEGAYTSSLQDSPNKSLRKCYRINCGYTNGSLRYPFDQYDRIWDADQNYTPFHLSTSFDIQSTFNLSSNNQSLPLSVLQTARVLTRRDDLTYNLPLSSILGDYSIVLYFAGILPVSPTFDVLIDGGLLQSNYTVKSGEVSNLSFTIYGINNMNITLKSTRFYPLLSAIEVFEIVYIPAASSLTTVSALQVIQKSTGLDLGWEDDPCYPFPWDHIGCTGSLVTSLDLSNIILRSIGPRFGDLLDLQTLDLHNSSLAGAIQNLGSLQQLEKLNLSFNQLKSFGSELGDLVNLQVLDLRNNSIDSIVPDSLGQLKSLHLLNLEYNKLQGTLPQSLNRQTLDIRTSGNLCVSFSMSTCTDADMSRNSSIEAPQVTLFTTTKTHSSHIHIVVILAAIGGVIFALVIVSVAVVLYVRRKDTGVTFKDSMDMRDCIAAKSYSYKEIKAATKNFKEVIGRGSFGSVFVGKFPNGKQVAVKVRYDNSQLGAEAFINEVCLLSQIRHQNLVSLEGFCHESKQQILVYEYLPGGSLADNLYGAKSKKMTLGWGRRLKIAVDAAKALDYLHNGSEPRIIHRDVKSSNIMLDKEMNAKVCDFGLSKQVTQADASHVTTVVKGTAGYLDPEYYATQQLTEKSDIFSFGVVLLELICGREPLSRAGAPDSFNLVLWAKPYLQAGAFEIVDEQLKGTFAEESMHKAAAIAARSVERDAAQRPNIAEVLAELKEAYSIQLSYLATAGTVS